MTVFPSLPPAPEPSHFAAPQRQWLARLELVYGVRQKRCIVQRVHHFGPLRVQRAFYPEGEDWVHTYLLHPPGGLVNGDRIELDVHLQAAAQVLITTPSAGKAYRCLGQDLRQSQSVRCVVDEGAVLEWLPQENIVFNGARVDLDWAVELAPGARFAAWELLCLGRPAAGEYFEQGEVVQNLRVDRGGRPVYRERLALSGGSDVLAAPWGLDGCACVGTFLLSLVVSQELLDQLRQIQPRQGRLAFSQRGELLMVRYLGAEAEAGRLCFEAVWHRVRPLLAGRAGCRPRIWNT